MQQLFKKLNHFHPDTEASLSFRQKLLKNTSIIQAISEMTRTSKFPVLKNDGIVALSLIFADSQSEIGKETISEGKNYTYTWGEYYYFYCIMFTVIFYIYIFS